ncbi:MAG: YihY/virulence factor BrkB family protein [Candidatus Cyclobacteriaceae bacterium M3_2C_046]
MKNFFRKSWKIIKEMKKEFGEKDPVVYSASIAFFTIFSMPSILMIIVNILSSVLDRDKIIEQVSGQIEELIGPQSAEQVESVIKNAVLTGSGFFSTTLSIVILLISATVIFNFIQQALNNIWEVKPKPKKGFLKFLQDRLLSFSLIIILGFLMLVSLAKDAVFNLFRDTIEQYIGETSFIMTLANSLVSFAVTTAIFALVFKVLPDAKIKWRDVWVGALGTAILFTIGKYVIGIILGNMQITNTYDAAGSLVGLLLWVFYSSIVVMIGAIFTKVYANQYGKQIQPTKMSVRVKKEEIEMEGPEDKAKQD